MGGSLLSAAVPDVCTIDTVELEGHVNPAPQLTSVPPNPAADSKEGEGDLSHRMPAILVTVSSLPPSPRSLFNALMSNTRGLGPQLGAGKGGLQAYLAGVGWVQAPSW